MPSYVENILMSRCPEDLQEVNGVQFTTRQIDILSCFLNGKNPKSIANLLSISQKTVESHGKNIRQRTGHFSLQHLISFVEESGKTLLLKKYYLILCGKIHFEKTLQKISTIKKEREKILVLNPESSSSPNDFSELLVAHLRKSGLEVIVQKKPALRKLKKENTLLILFSKNFYDLKKNKSLGCTLDYLFTGKDVQNPKSVILISLDEEGKSFISKLLKQKAQISFEDREHYFASFLDLLKYLFPQSEKLKEIIVKFHRDYSCLWEPAQKINSQLNRTNKILDPPLHLKNFSQPNKQKTSEFIFVTASFIILSLFTSAGIFIFSKQNNQNFKACNAQKYPPQAIQQESIRSDLPLPHESVLLRRPYVLQTIDKKLKDQEGIKTIALVGIGGVGKTTLVRQYARSTRSNKESIVWELNAETKDSLVNSFEDLAYATAKTEKEKRDLRFLQEIKNQDRREKSLFIIVKKKLRAHSAWLLIYDNVENLSDVKKYFPSDSTVWGSGKVLITSRNKNIKNNALINSKSVINIQELSCQEQYYLFKNILYGKGSKISAVQKKEIGKFLKNLPPFPLDISTAAYYIKEVNIPFEEYLKRTNILNEDFEKSKISLLKELTIYAKTRYGVIALSLEKIIRENPDFKELLFFISLLDSQNIPIEILNKYKKEAVVEKFIHQLRKNSFITSEQSVEKILSFSLHRSTQIITLTYLINNNLKKNLPIQKIAEFFEKYIFQTSYQVNLSMLSLLISHGASFLQHKDLINTLTQESIKSELGQAYYLLGYYTKAKEYFKVGKLSNLKNIPKKLQEKVIYNALYKGSLYKDLGKYKKAENFIERAFVLHKKYTVKNLAHRTRILTFLGIINDNLGNYRKSKKLLKRSLMLQKKLNKENHKLGNWLLTLIYLGNVYNNLGHYEKAKYILEKCLKICKKDFGNSSVRVSRVMVYLEKTYTNLGLYKEAKILGEKSLEIFKNFYSKKHNQRTWPLLYLAFVYNKLGLYKRSKILVEKSMEIQKVHYGDNHIRTSWSLVTLGHIYVNLGDYDQGKIFLKRAQKIQEKFYGEKHIQVFWVLFYLGELYKKLGKNDKAKKKFNKALYICTNNFGKHRIKNAQTLRALAEIYILEEQLKKAEENLQKTLKIYQKTNHSDIYLCLETLGDLSLKKLERSKINCEKNKFKSQAKEYYRQSLGVLKKHFPKGCLHTKRLENKLARK